MNIYELGKWCEEHFSDETVMNNLIDFARKDSFLEDGCFSLWISGDAIKVPVSDGLKIVALVTQINMVPVYYEVRVVVALGGVLKEECGIVTPKHCFLKLYYGEALEIYTFDVDWSEMGLLLGECKDSYKETR